MSTSTITHVPAALRTWSTLPAPTTTDGRWAASFLTPLRQLAPAGLALMGLPRWYGKDLAGDRGVNLVRGPGATALHEALPMRIVREASWRDGRPAVVATYAADARRPWRWVRDELRALDEATLLGLTFADLPGGRRLGLPFLLHRV